MEYMTWILAGNLEFLLKIVTVQDLWLSNVDRMRAPRQLHAEGKYEARLRPSGRS
jgi:hypothetical protein